MAHVVVSSLPEGTAFSRYVIAKSMGLDAGLTMAHGWTGLPQIEECLRQQLDLRTKTPVDPMTSGDVTHAAPLAQAGISRELIALLRGQDAVEQLRPYLRRVPVNVRIPIETGAGTGGAWIGEASAMPVVQDAFATITQGIFKAGTIAVVTRELLTVNPDNEALIRSVVAAGVAAFSSQQFLDPTVAAVPNVQPASVTNGITGLTSSGGTGANICADLASLLGSITTPGGRLVWVMRPASAGIIAARLASIGASTDLPRSLFGFPVVLSPASPRQITLIDGDGILFSDLGGPQIDVSTEATVEMQSSATSPITTATILISLLQHNLAAIRVVRWLSWQRAAAGAVSWMTTTY